MSNTLFEYVNDFCQAYLKDIFIYNRIEKQHQKHVRKVLLQLCKAGLKIEIEKCQYHVQEIIFLRLIISTEGLRIDPNKIEVIVNWQTSTCLKEVQAFADF